MAERARHSMPKDVSTALTSSGVRSAYDQRPPYQRNDYIGWIVEAKQPETREKRIKQMVDELKSGDIYMNMPWHGSGSKG